MKLGEIGERRGRYRGEIPIYLNIWSIIYITNTNNIINLYQKLDITRSDMSEIGKKGRKASKIIIVYIKYILHIYLLMLFFIKGKTNR